MWSFPLWPDQASTFAKYVDGITIFVLAICVAIGAGVVIAISYFAAKYHHSRNVDRTNIVHTNIVLELIWSAIPLALSLVMFAGGAAVFLHLRHAPADALEVYVVGKQWMWKIQHPQGRQEINALHVPVGRPIKLLMTSQDVIHSFYIPAFRIKQDVLPGRYTEQWFEATKPGTYHLFCAEYCGTSHAAMIGSVVVMTPSDFEKWLGGVAGNEPMEQSGERLFNQYGCMSCHTGSSARGPALNGLHQKSVELQDGSSTTADDSYLRESILNPTAKIVKGYNSIMPSYQTQLGEQDVAKLIAYIKSLRKP